MASPRLEQLVVTIRDPATKSAPFRAALQEIGQLLTYELQRTLDKKDVRVTTCMGKSALHYVPAESPILVPILRAGLPLWQGAMLVYPDSEVGFLASSRNEDTLEPIAPYQKFPEVTGKKVIIYDTMLATGGSTSDAVKRVLDRGASEVYALAAIAAIPGIERVSKLIGRDHVVAAAIDDELNAKGYIVPGLGDAGDRCYGKPVETKHPV